MSNIQAVSGGALDSQEALFVRYVIEGLRPKHALRRAGYKFSDTILERLQSTPRVQIAIKSALTLQFQTNDAPAARKVVRDLMDDVSNSNKIRLECAKLLLNRGGYAELKAVPVKEGIDKSPSEMTGAELQARIDKLQGEIGARAAGAKVIEGILLDDLDDDTPQDIDIFG